jgi:hypothetical protein
MGPLKASGSNTALDRRYSTGQRIGTQTTVLA